MQVQLIRNATHILEIAGKRIVVDPMFSPAGSFPPIPNTTNRRRDPLTELPVTVSEILQGLDAILITHAHHMDHFDDAAAGVLPKYYPVICQPEDEEYLQQKGYLNLLAVIDTAQWEGITFTRTQGHHGKGEMAKQLGPVSGFILEAEKEPILFIAGDTVWHKDVNEAIIRYCPDVIILYAGAAQFLIGDPITMTKEDVVQVRKASPESSVIVVHMEALEFCTLTRDQLYKHLLNHNCENQFHIPKDGETIYF